MKQILFLLLFASQIQAQTIATDSIFARNDSVFILRKELKYEFLADTMELHARLLQIDNIIDVFEAEQDEIRDKLIFFKLNGPGSMMQAPAQPKSVQPAKQPATKPKSKN